MTAWCPRTHHRLVIPALLALATVAAVLLPAAPAQAQSITTVWSATLTVDAIAANNVEYQGCDDNDATQDDCSSALSDNDFMYEGTTYQIKVFYIRSYPPSSVLVLKFDKAIPKNIRNALTLHVGSSQFALSSLYWDSDSGNKSATKLASGLGPWTDGQSVSLKLTAPAKPAKPTGLTAKTGNGKVELTWTDPSDSSITKYQYHYTGSNARLSWRDIPNSAPGGTNATSYTVTNLNNGNAYRFRIRAVNAAGDGAPSDIVAVTLPAGPSIPIPAKPTGLTATAGNGQVELAWTDPSDSSITKYQYQQKAGTNAWGDWTDIPNSAPGGTNATSYTVTNLNNGTAYRFRIRAVNVVDRSLSPNGVQSDIAGPATPVSGDTTGPAVSFIAVTSSPPAGQGGYYKAGDAIAVTVTFNENIVITGTPQLKIRVGSGAGSEKPANCAAHSTDATKLACTYMVASGDEDSNGIAVETNKLALDGGTIKDTDGNAATLTYAASIALAAQSGHKVDAVAPAAPRNLAAGDGTVRLTWSDPSPADSTIAKWQYRWKAGSGNYGNWQDVSGDAAARAVDVTGLMNGTVYTFQICAVDTATNAGAAATVGLVTPSDATPPDGVWAVASDGSLTLNWNDPSDATITRYQYQIKKARSSWQGWKAIPNSDAATTSHTVTGLENGTAYTLRIRAVDRGGAGAASKYVRATPSVAVSSAALTARAYFTTPAAHLGKEKWVEVTIKFSEAVTVRAKTAAATLQVEGGRVTKAKSAHGRSLWIIRVKPNSDDPVTVTLPATENCGAKGAVCTTDGRRLMTPLTVTVASPLTLSVADARAKEGEDATIDFVVTLSRATSQAVTVRYRTKNGTAQAGQDYVKAKGTLVFAPGETAKTISVPLLDDAHDEGAETFTLILKKATGAIIADGEAVGTIENADPLQRAWLARFGRTVGTHVTDAVGERLRAAPGPGSSLTVGGYRVPLGKPAGRATNKSATAPTEAEASASALLHGLAGVLGLGPAQSGAGGPAPDTPWRAEPGLAPLLGQSQPLNLDLRQLLLGSSFRLNLGAGAGDSSYPRLTAWGRFAGTTFDGQDGDLSLDGDVFTGTVGVDREWDRLLAGVAVAHSRGDGSFTMPGTAERGQGDLEQTLTSIHPYLRYAVTDRLDVWGLVGYGWGELDLETENGETLETDTTLVMGAFGGRGILFSPADTGGFQLATRTDAMLTRTSSDKVAGLEGADADAHRVRLILEGSRGYTWEEGRSLTPTVELGLRHDWGDAETGFGLELGGRVQYADPSLGLTVDAGVRGLLAHEDDDYEEWGAWGTVRVAPGVDGRGLALTLAPAWGATASGVEGLWARQTTQGLAPQGPQGPAAGRLTAEVGYGFPGWRAGARVTPYGGVTLAQGGTQQYRLGSRLAIDDGLTLNLEGAHQQPGGQTPADTGLLLQVEWPW